MKLVYIEWHDAQDLGQGWKTEEDISSRVQEEFIVKEVGWLYEETEKYIVIASQKAWQDELFGHLTRIPKGWIRKRKILKI